MLINLFHLVIIFWITDCVWFFVMLIQHLIEEAHDVTEDNYEEEDSYDE